MDDLVIVKIEGILLGIEVEGLVVDTYLQAEGFDVLQLEVGDVDE